MSKSPIHNQILLNDGAGNKLAIQTGTWISPAINIDDHRRLSFTIGVGSATGAAGDTGGFTGTLQVQGTNELGNAAGATGSPWAFAGQQPGVNGSTGGLFWQNLASGTTTLTSSTTAILLSFTDVGPSWVRIGFNLDSNSNRIATAIGSGTMYVWVTAKNT